MKSINELKVLINQVVEDVSEDIVEISTVEELVELSSVAGGAAEFGASRKKKPQNESISRKSIIEEQYMRKIIRKLLIEKTNNENQIRAHIRTLIKESEISDTHPHRSTAINVLEKVLKKVIPNLRPIYKSMTTDPKQRNSFRAHFLKAVYDSLKPDKLHSQYLQGDPSGVQSALMAAPVGLDEQEEEAEGDADIDQALKDVEVEPEPEKPEDKKIPVEDDDTPSDEEKFGAGLEDMDETGRNMSFEAYKNNSTYMKGPYDALANPQDKEVYVEYLMTNLMLYFDKFDDELKTIVDAPKSAEYEKMKQAGE